MFEKHLSPESSWSHVYQCSGQLYSQAEPEKSSSNFEKCSSYRVLEFGLCKQGLHVCQSSTQPSRQTEPVTSSSDILQIRQDCRFEHDDKHPNSAI